VLTNRGLTLLVAGLQHKLYLVYVFI